MADFDLAFSYWIFVWFFMYEVKITGFNPKIWLMIAMIHNVFLFVLFIYFGHSLSFILLFLFIIIFIKIIPLWILRKTAYRLSDFIAGIALYGLFFVWKYIRLGSIEKIIQADKNEWNQLKQKRPVTPLISFLYENGWIKYE